VLLQSNIATTPQAITPESQAAAAAGREMKQGVEWNLATIIKSRSTNPRADVDLPGWLVDALRASSYGHKDYFFYDGVVSPASAIKVWYRRLQPIFDAANISLTNSAGAKVEMHPYLFRHYFASSKIADDFTSDDLAGMMGNSVAQIEKTYKHRLKKGSKRILAKQQQVWLAQGLDENGNT
jgi:integrase